jgi:hypothetical protein
MIGTVFKKMWLESGKNKLPKKILQKEKQRATATT